MLTITAPRDAIDASHVRSTSTAACLGQSRRDERQQAHRANRRRPSRRSPAQAEVLRRHADDDRRHEAPGPADRVHQPRRGPAVLGPDHVEERGEDVGIVDPLAQPGADQARRSAAATDVDHPVRKTNGAPRIRPRLCTRIRPPLRPPRRPVGQHSAAERAGEAGQRPDRRGHRRAGQAQVETLEDERRQPGQEGRRHEVRPDEDAQEQAPPRGLVTIRATLSQSESSEAGRPARSSSTGSASPPASAVVRLAADRFDQAEAQEHAHRPIPTRPRTKNGDRQPYRSPRKPASTRPAGRAQVDARLVDAQRPRARPRPVIIGQERHRRREVERLAQPLGGPEEEQLAEVPRQARRRADQAPERQARRGSAPVARQPIDHVAGERRRRGVDDHERRAEHAELGLRRARTPSRAAGRPS